MTSEHDTHLKVILEEGIDDQEPEVLDGTGYSESIKVGASHVVIANKTFVGAPSEDDIDIVGHDDVIIGPNNHSGSRAPQSITLKGGAQGALFRGSWKKAVIGQYSNYDRWFKRRKTGRINFEPTSTGYVELWWAEMPRYVPPGVRLKKINPIIVYGYFLFRSIQQTFSPPPK